MASINSFNLNDAPLENPEHAGEKETLKLRIFRNMQAIKTTKRKVSNFRDLHDSLSSSRSITKDLQLISAEIHFLRIDHS